MDIDGPNPLLPQDIMTNILIRLPVKSLIRCQCVCKVWKNLFKTPSFIAEHLHHSSHQNPYLLFEDLGKSDNFRLYSLDGGMQILELPDYSLFDDVKGLDLRTFGSCNGLLCMGFFSSSPSLLVWNPATREVRRLPRSISYFEDAEFYMEFYIGFGFSPIVDDYKIVEINAQEDDGRVNEVKVYSLSIGSWKDVQFGNLDGVGITSNGFCFNGAIFWIGYKIDLEEDVDEVGWIVSFDIAMEVFASIPIPSSPFSITNTPYPSYLTAHENKLALLSHTLSGDRTSLLIHLWVMEAGTCGSRERWVWTKKYISSPYLGYLLVPVAIWRNEVVCIVASSLSEPIDKIEDDERKPVLLNLTTNEFKASDIRRPVLFDGIFHYSESLVPVGNIHTE